MLLIYKWRNNQWPSNIPWSQLFWTQDISQHRTETRKLPLHCRFSQVFKIKLRLLVVFPFGAPCWLAHTPSTWKKSACQSLLGLLVRACWGCCANSLFLLKHISWPCRRLWNKLPTAQCVSTVLQSHWQRAILTSSFSTFIPFAANSKHPCFSTSSLVCPCLHFHYI